MSEIITIHRFEFDSDYESPGESHDFWEIVFVDYGEITCTAGDKRVTCSAGEMLFHHPGEFHTLKAEAAKRARVFIVSFTCTSEAMKVFERRKITVPYNRIKLMRELMREGGDVFDLSADSPSVTELALRPDAPLGGKQMIKNMLEILLIALLRRENGRRRKPVFLHTYEVGGRVARQVIEFLERNVEERIDADDICAAVHYAKSYVYQEFHNATGKSMMAFFTEMKIERAKTMLMDDRMNVNEIASSLGFDSSNYFTKTFRRITGKSPSEWKRDAKAEEAKKLD